MELQAPKRGIVRCCPAEASEKAQTFAIARNGKRQDEANTSEPFAALVNPCAVPTQGAEQATEDKSEYKLRHGWSSSLGAAFGACFTMARGT